MDTVKPWKHDPTINEPLELAKSAFNTPGFDFTKNKPYLATSVMDDVYTIGFWSMYWTGQLPKKVRKSRGDWYRVDVPKYGDCYLRVIDRMDHRKGIEQKERL